MDFKRISDAITRYITGKERQQGRDTERLSSAGLDRALKQTEFDLQIFPKPSDQDLQAADLLHAVDAAEKAGKLRFWETPDYNGAFVNLLAYQYQMVFGRHLDGIKVNTNSIFIPPARKEKERAWIGYFLDSLRQQELIAYENVVYPSGTYVSLKKKFPEYIKFRNSASASVKNAERFMTYADTQSLKTSDPI